jgi:beta-lactamase regulating signal transducer with metallopeptidase domain
MTADWMIYCALWSLPISAAAWLIERVLRRGRAPLRGVWIAALSLLIVGPVVGYALPRASAVAPASSPNVSLPGVVVTSYVPLRHASPPLSAVPRPEASTNTALVVWAMLSAAVLLYVALGFGYLGYLRRRWRAARVCDTEVMVSEGVGPAVVGILRPQIVIPEWVLELDPRQLSLVLRHEREHQRAGDAALLALAQLVVVAVPWNPIAWWQVRRLRLAIELDCDARVLRAEPDVRSYGNLLLDVRRPRRAFAFAGASLADRAGDLEQRIRMMTRGSSSVSRWSIGLSLAAGVIAVLVGCGLPAPQHPTPAEATPAPKAAPAPTTMVVRDSVVDTTRSAARSKALKAELISGDSAEKLRVTWLLAEVRNRLRELADSVVHVRRDSSLRRSIDSLSRFLPDSIQGLSEADRENAKNVLRDLYVRTELLRAMGPFVVDSDSAAAAATSSGCSAGVGSDDSPVVKLLVSDALARRGGRIDIDGSAAKDGRTSVILNDPDKANPSPMWGCSMIHSGTLRLYGPDAFNSRPIVVSVADPTSVIVMTGSGRLLAGPVIVANVPRKYQLSWKATAP